MSIDGSRWLLLNCSPDIAAQIEEFVPLQPHNARSTPISGMLFSDANVDHLGGLATLRQRGPHRFIIRSSEIVRELAISQPAFAPFAREPHHWTNVRFDGLCEPIDRSDFVGNEIEVHAIPVPGMTPGYAGRRTIEGAVTAYEIRERSTGGRVLFAPVFAAIDEVLFNAIVRADVAFLDGSFYRDDELVTNGFMNKTARDLGHHPVGGGGGTLARLDGHGARIIFTHLNNSNPMLDPSSEEALQVRQAGANIAYDGMEITV